MAFEYGAMGITSNAISPGGVETDLMTEDRAGPQRNPWVSPMNSSKTINAKETSIKRLNTVEEVAAVALLLASEAGGRHHRCNSTGGRRHRAVIR